MFLRRIGTCALTLVVAASFVGCNSSSKRTTSSNTTRTQNNTSTASRYSDRDNRVATTDAHMQTASMAFPTGEKSSSVLLVQKRVPAQVRAGQPFEYDITVTNISDEPLDQVVVFDRVPNGLVIRRADMPTATASRNTTNTTRTTTTTQGATHFATAGHTNPNLPDEFIVHSGPQGTGVYANPADADRYGKEPAPGVQDNYGEGKNGIRPEGAAGRTTTTTRTQQTTTQDNRASAGVDPNRMYAGRIIQPGEAMVGGEWRVGHLNPKESKTIRVQGTSDETGLLQSCTTVSYLPSLCMATQVVKPQIRIERLAPAEANACEPITIRYRVTNVGTGTATGVRVNETMAAGLRADREAAFTIDELGEGQSKEFTTTVRGDQPGRIVGRAIATDSSGARVESAESATEIRAPKLEVSVTAPEVAYTSVPVDYRVRVINRGNGAARNVTVRQSLGQGVRVSNASLGGRQQGNEAVWSIDNLGPGESREMIVTLQGGGEGVVRTTVNAEAVCAQQVSATIQTRMEAISALLLEVVDTNDPVQVGREVNYVITVKNQGDKLDRNIRLVVTLPEEEEFASAPGQFQPQQMNAGQPNKADNAPANADAGVPPAQGGKQILFVIPELGPKQTATVNLNCKALRPGDVRFRVDMTSENLTKPVMETESTKLF